MLSCFLFLLFLTLVKGDCPLGCSANRGQGRCVSNRCVCNAGYQGSDCSIYVRAITSGQQINSTIRAFDWSYFSIANSVVGGNIDFETAPTTQHIEDCDIYVSFGEIPTKESYQARDITYGSYGSIHLTQAKRGTYYIGLVSGDRESHVSLVVSVQGSCNVTCQHGTCVSGRCQCDSGYSGEACDIAVQNGSLELNKQYSSSVNQNAWKYFVINITKPLDEMLLIVNITNQNPKLHDCDVFIRKNAVPDDYHWDYQDVTSDANFVVTIPNVTVAQYYIGFWGFKQSDFNFILQTKDDHHCLSNCSNHGTCQNRCICTGDYTGSYCETKSRALQTNEEATGFVSANVWNYFTYVSNTQDNVIIVVNQSVHQIDGGNTFGDCDLYVKFGASPTKFDFDYKDTTNNRSFELVIPNALQDTLYIGIYGYQTCLYRLRVITSTGCANQCAVHGRCVNGTCVCQTGWSGENCESNMEVLRNKVLIEGTMTAANQWRYFNFTCTTFTFGISMREYSVGHNDSFLYLMIAENRFPTLRDSDLKDDALRSQFHTLAAAVSTRKVPPLNFVVGIYSSPFFRSSTSYKIIAWQPDF